MVANLFNNFVKSKIFINFARNYNEIMSRNNINLFEQAQEEDRRTVATAVIPLFTDGILDLALDENKLCLGNLPIIASRDMVLFPGMTMPLSIGRTKSLRVLEEVENNHCYIGIFMQKTSADDPASKDLYHVGALADVIKVLEMPDGTKNIIVQGRRLLKLENLITNDPYLRGEVSIIDEQYPSPRSRKMKALLSNVKDDIKKMSGAIDNSLPPEINFAIANFNDIAYLTTFLCSSFPMPLTERQGLLEETDFFARAMRLSSIVNREMQFALIKSKLQRETMQEISDVQRKHFLYTQIQTIKEELGESSQDDIDKLLSIANKKQMSEAALDVFKKEINKLQKMNEQSPDYSMQHTYLRTFVDLPWGNTTKDNMSLQNAKKVLDQDHYGLEKVKERILEHLAVLKLRGDMKSPIICLVGPPGVGKTSLGKSIARALKREYVRVSFGGLHDEAEIRGHRKTYIGALPGRIMKGLISAGSDNPVFVLDEIDKIGADFKGDPASALLEVLDPEQNFAFHDNYIDVDYDLSKVLFIATANTLSTIAAPLRDRMEIIDLSGYILEEKVEIAERHLLPKQKEEHGLKGSKFSIPKKVMAEIVGQYTRESGVRLLDKRLAKIMRKIAWKTALEEEVPTKLSISDLEDYLGKPDFDPDKYEGNQYYGVVTGLAWTSVGGCILYVESSLSKGKGEKLTLTGNLGDVMKESATLAYQYIKAHAEELGISQETLESNNVHIHCPEGATPKDGPSAGITMVTSLASSFCKRKVRERIAMTGEISLRGRVLPIGGVKEKILAAKRAGITDLVLCEDNRKDVEEISKEYIAGLTFHYFREVKDVLDYVLL